MASVVLYVNAAGSADNWTKVGGLSVVNTMNSDDGNTSYYNIAGEGGIPSTTHSFDFDAMPGDSVLITSHTPLWNGAKRSGTNKTVTPAVNFTGWVTGNTQTYTVNNAYASFTRVDLDTATPTIAQMDSAEMRLQLTAGAIGDFGWSYTIWTITYIPSAGGFNWLISEWLPPLLSLCSGAGLICREAYSELKRIQVKNAPRTISESIARNKEKRIMRVLPSNKEEFEMLKNGLLVRRKYCFMGG